MKLETEDDKILRAEDHKDFIGPKLPRMMTKAEVEEFQRELFAKWDLDQGNIMNSFGLLSYTNIGTS